jgi:hypothetical protein|tara:strand:- start:335 stop:712 length:378 start_codon:yes stop_codon:yes gene_type:complete
MTNFYGVNVPKDFYWHDDVKKTYKVGSNRGHKRVWIEGPMLLNIGFKKGIVFSRVMHEELKYVTMELTADPFGKHKIAGTEARPIIDLNGKYLDELFYGYTHYEATFNVLSGTFKPYIKIVGVNL